MAGSIAGCIEYSERENLIIQVPKGRKETLEEYAAQNNESVNTMTNRLLRVYIGMSEKEWSNNGST